MKLSKSYWKTYKEVPSEAEIPSHQLLLRAGFIQRAAGGIYSYLPFATRVLRKIKNIIREEHEAIGSQEILMGMVTPANLWEDSGRWDTMGPEMLRFKDRKDQDFCLSPTNEETVTDIFRKTVSSYKDLPVNLFQINTKFRDETRPRFGLLRGREFIMKDAYSFHMDMDSLHETYEDFYSAYSNIFKRMKLDYIIVEADAGAMGSSDSKTHEFQVLASNGEDTVVTIPEINYAANIERAQTKRKDLTTLGSTTLEKVETPNMKSCEEVTEFLKEPIHHSIKTLIYTADYGKKNVNYMILLLGDDSLNEVKLKNYLKAQEIFPASDEDLEELGLPAGFMGPLDGVDSKMSVLVDEQIQIDGAYIIGANEVDYHVKGFVPSRDIEKYKITDLRVAKEGDYSLDEKYPVVFKKGIEVGHIFELGQKYTKSMEAFVLDQNGKNLAPFMGCYGIGVSRTMAAAIEQCHDENGIIWPAPIAPYHVYLGYIGKKDSTKDTTNKLYEDLRSKGVEVLFDDRGLSPGIMFKDSDLLGLPLRVVLGERDFEKSGELEVKLRKSGETFQVKLEDILSFINEKLSELL